MRITSHFCYKCHGFMKVELKNNEYELICPVCEKKREDELNKKI